MTRVAFIAGPYRSPYGAWFVRKNVERAADLAAKCWQLGYSVICPATNSAFFSGLEPEERFLKAYLEILTRCDLVVAVEGWEKSEGATAEVEMAHGKGIPVYLEIGGLPPVFED